MTICTGIFCSSHSTDEISEEVYSSVYKHLITTLYSTPNIFCTFYFSGPQLEWLEKNHKEFLQILRELADRKQIEVLGGGYYNPIFPLLLPVDRVGQTELLTTSIRKAIDKRPRGAWLTGSVWDQSLISPLNSCGMNYVMLDSQYLGSASNPLIIEDMGKTLTVLPYNSAISENTPEFPETYYDYIKKSAKSSTCVFEGCFFDASKLCSNIKDDFFTEFYNYLLSDQKFTLSLPSAYLKTSPHLKKTYLASGAAPSVLRHFLQNRTSHKNVIRNYLIDFPEAMQLYVKMMRTSILVNQHRGDRVRKIAAREALWKAQNSSAYWFLESDGLSNQKVRKNAYQHLLTASSIIRKTQGFLPSATSYDYDLNGFVEYSFQFLTYNFVVSQDGGTIYDFDSLVAMQNYTNTMQRSKDYDALSDLYPKKMFVDHILNKNELLSTYGKTFKSNNTFLPQKKYSEVSFDRVKREVLLQVEGMFDKQNYTLKKKYSSTPSGIKVQYILKNNSDKQLECCFAIENNLSFDGNTHNDLQIDAVMNSSLQSINPELEYISNESVSYVELKDLTNSISFLYGVNEEAGVFISPLTITRPIENRLTESYQATTVCFFWNLSVPVGSEIEKTITLTVPSTKNRKRDRKSTKKS